MIKKIEVILAEYPSITVEDIENQYNNDFGSSVIMLLGENGYFVKDPYPYKSWGSIPLSKILEDLKRL